MTFSYPSRPHQLALDAISLVFPAGETTFIVGSSGSGKSTLTNLLFGLYGVTSGSLLVDGLPLTNLDIDWLRKNITIVQQQSDLFNESMVKNVAFGYQGAVLTNTAMMQSLEFALLHNGIRDLPKGINTQVGYGGDTLSGGQKQRLALARARLRDTPVLVLDEATSALDSLTRTKIMKNIRAWRQERTTVVITHDMSQVLADDFVYVLENGMVSEQGFKHMLSLGAEDKCIERPGSVTGFPRISESHDCPMSSFGFSLEGGTSISPDVAFQENPKTPRREGRETTPKTSVETSSEESVLSSGELASPIDPRAPLMKGMPKSPTIKRD